MATSPPTPSPLSRLSSTLAPPSLTKATSKPSATPRPRRRRAENKTKRPENAGWKTFREEIATEEVRIARGALVWVGQNQSGRLRTATDAITLPQAEPGTVGELLIMTRLAAARSLALMGRGSGTRKMRSSHSISPMMRSASMLDSIQRPQPLAFPPRDSKVRSHPPPSGTQEPRKSWNGGSFSAPFDSPEPPGLWPCHSIALVGAQVRVLSANEVVVPGTQFPLAVQCLERL